MIQPVFQSKGGQGSEKAEVSLSREEVYIGFTSNAYKEGGTYIPETTDHSLHD